MKKLNPAALLATLCLIASQHTWAAGPAVTALAKEVDKIEETTWYRDKTSPKHDNVNNVFLYIGEKKGQAPWLRLRMQYVADNWLFIKTATIVIDGKKSALIAGKWERDHSSGRIWEWSDTSVTSSEIGTVKAMASAKEVIVRYEGDKYQNDRTLTKKELAAIGAMLKAYAEMGGK